MSDHYSNDEANALIQYIKEADRPWHLRWTTGDEGKEVDREWFFSTEQEAKAQLARLISD